MDRRGSVSKTKAPVVLRCSSRSMRNSSPRIPRLGLQPLAYDDSALLAIRRAYCACFLGAMYFKYAMMSPISLSLR